MKRIKVYSRKNDISGEILDAGVVITLKFDYKGKDIEIGISRPFKESLKEIGEKMIDSYVEKLSGGVEKRKVQLHYWCMYEFEKEGKKYKILNGIVTGHSKIKDGTFIHTSIVNEVTIDEKKEELVATTQNNVYHCQLKYCKFGEQDGYKKLIPDYEIIRNKYMNKIDYPEIEAGKVLLVVSNFDQYYFHSLHCVKREGENPINYSAYPHVGTFQDSFLIQSEDWNIDLRYFPHFQNLEFYSEDTDEMPLYIENIGDAVFYFKISIGLLMVEPGQRKEVCKENVENESPHLPDGDLYPMRVIDDTKNDIE